MTTVQHKTPIPPPGAKSGATPVALSAEEQQKYDAVLRHFSDPNFELQISPEKKAPLSEEERFWLVTDVPFALFGSSNSH